MTPEARLAELEQLLRNEFGCWTRYENDVHAQHGDTASIEQRIAVAEAVLREGSRGVAGHMREVQRKQRRSQSS